MEHENTGFVGRIAELRVLEAAWEQVCGGTPKQVVLSGVAGIGKSAIAEAFLVAGARRSVRVSGDDGKPIPYVAVAALVESLGRLSVEAQLEIETLASLGALLSGNSISVELERTLPLDVIALLRSATLREPVAVLLDNFDRFDAESQSLFLRVWAALANGQPSVLSIVTLREIHDDQLERLHSTTLLEVPVLDEVTSSVLIRAHRPNASVAFLEEVALAGGHNPRFMLHSLAFARERDGIVTIDVSRDREVDRLLKRIARSARPVCDVLSVARHPIPLDTIAELLSRPVEEIESIVEGLEDQGDVRSYIDGAELAHPLVKYALRSSLRAESRSRIAARLVDVFEREGADAVLLAEYALDAQNQLAPKRRNALLAEGARCAFDDGAWQRGRRLFDAAATTNIDDLDVETRLRFRLQAARTRMRDSDHSVVSALQSVIDDAEAAGLTEIWADAVLVQTRAALVSTTLNDPLEATTLLLRVIERVPTSGVAAVEARTLLAERLLAAGQADEAEEWAKQAVDLGKSIPGAQDSLVRAYSALGWSALERVQPRAAVTWFEQAFPITGVDPVVSAGALTRGALAYFLTGDLDRAERRALEGVTHAEKHHDFTEVAIGMSVLAWIALSVGDQIRLRSLLTQARVHVERTQYPWGRLLLEPCAIAAALLLDDVNAARGVAQSWRASGDRVGLLVSHLLDAGEVNAKAALSYRDLLTIEYEVGNAIARRDRDACRALAERLERLEQQGVVLLHGSGRSIELLRSQLLFALGDTNSALTLAISALRSLSRRRAAVECVRAARLVGGYDVAHGLTVEQQVRTLVETSLATAMTLGISSLTDGVRPDVAAAVDGPIRVFLMVDVVDSTPLVQALGGARWSNTLADLDRRVRRALARSGGRLIDTAGDGWFARCDDAFTGARTAMEILRATEDIASERRIPIRIGVTSGVAVERSGRFFGAVVHLADRVCKFAEPGTVCATTEIAASLPPSVRSAPLGSHKLKGFDDAIALVRLDVVEEQIRHESEISSRAAGSDERA